MAVSADAAALARLTELDSAPVRTAVPTLVAEVGGELRAALPLDGGRAVADPFQRTAEIVTMLRARATQLDAPPRPRRRRRLLRVGALTPAARIKSARGAGA
jgi:hypothetical protein